MRIVNNMNFLKKWLGYVICSKCKKEFKKNKRTSLGGKFDNGNWEELYFCKDCSIKILEQAFSSTKKNPFKFEDLDLK